MTIRAATPLPRESRSERVTRQLAWVQRAIADGSAWEGGSAEDALQPSLREYLARH